MHTERINAVTHINTPDDVAPSADLTARFHAALAATLAFGGTFVIFSDAYPGDLRGDIEAFAAQHELAVGELDHVNATEIYFAGSHRSLLRVYWTRREVA